MAGAHGEAAAGQEATSEVVVPLAEAEALLSLRAVRRPPPLDGADRIDGTLVFRLVFMGSSRWAVPSARGCCHNNCSSHIIRSASHQLHVLWKGLVPAVAVRFGVLPIYFDSRPEQDVKLLSHCRHLSSIPCLPVHVPAELHILTQSNLYVCFLSATA